MTPKFHKFFNFLMKLEGGYSNNKMDRGGETNFGITQKLLSTVDYIKTTKVINLTEDDAREIYSREFFTPVQNLINSSGLDLNEKEQYHLFDVAVNSGIRKMSDILSKVDSLNPIVSLRKEWYNRIVTLNPSQRIFLKGWMNRLKRIEEEYK